MQRNFAFDSINIIGLTITIFNYVIFIPAIIYGLYIFHKLKDNDLIIYRNPFAVYLLNALVIIGLSTERIYVLFAQVFNIIDVPVWSVHFYFALTWDAIIYLKVTKVYYVYFQQQYNLSIAEKAWKENINPEDDTSSWYIQHKDTFGNMTYLIKCGVVPWTMASFFDLLMSSLVVDHWSNDFIHLAEGVLPIFVAFSILYKTRLINDIYHIRNEIFLAMIIIGASFVIYTIMFITRHFGKHYIAVYGDNVNRLESLVYLFVTEGIAIACSVLSTMYPAYLVQNHEKEMNVLNQQRNNLDADLQTMDFILSDYKSFTTFMSYLVSEFCPENLLFLVELIQCKHAYQKKNHYVVTVFDNDYCVMVDFNKNPLDASGNCKTEKEKLFTYLFHESGSIMTKFSLSTKIPQTAILSKNEDHLYFHMEALYNKYVKPGSPFELNISYSVHEKLKEIFEGTQKRLIKTTGDKKYPENQLFNVMDECAIQIVQLLQYSMARFMNSDAFNSIAEIQQELNLNHALSTDADYKMILNSQQTGIIKCLSS